MGTLDTSSLDLKLSTDSQRVIRRAAELRGVSVDAYILSQALASARRDITAGTTIRPAPENAQAN